MIIKTKTKSSLPQMCRQRNNPSNTVNNQDNVRAHKRKRKGKGRKEKEIKVSRNQTQRHERVA